MPCGNVNIPVHPYEGLLCYFMPLRSGLDPKLRPEYRPQPRPTEKSKLYTCLYCVIHLTDVELAFAGAVPSRVVFDISGRTRLPITHKGGVYVSNERIFSPVVSLLFIIVSSPGMSFNCLNAESYVALPSSSRQVCDLSCSESQVGSSNSIYYHNSTSWPRY